MTPLRSRVPFRRTPPSLRRKTSWGVGPEGTLTISDVTPAGFPITAVVADTDLTIVRIRGEVNMFLQVTDSGLGGFGRIGLGICIVSENAAGVGQTAVPHPITDLAWDGWLWHWTGSLQTPLSSTEGTGLAGSDSYRLVIDNKAMRKIHTTDTIIGMVECT